MFGNILASTVRDIQVAGYSKYAWYFNLLFWVSWAGQRCRYSGWLWAGRSGDRIPVGAIFSAPVQTVRGAHPASCTMGTGCFPGVKNGRGVLLTTHPLLVTWSRKSRAIPLIPLWAVRSVQSLSACTRVHFKLFTFLFWMSGDAQLRGRKKDVKSKFILTSAWMQKRGSVVVCNCLLEEVD